MALAQDGMGHVSSLRFFVPISAGVSIKQHGAVWVINNHQCTLQSAKTRPRAPLRRPVLRVPCQRTEVRAWRFPWRGAFLRGAAHGRRPVALSAVQKT